MDLLSGYGSDESEKSQGNEPSPKRTRREESSPSQRERTTQSPPRRLGQLDRKKSRWAKASAFLAPVQYDSTDVIDDDSDAEEKASHVVKGTLNHSRPLLTSMLPAPMHTIQNKNEPNVGDGQRYDTQQQSRETESASEFSRNINSAPNVRGIVSAPGIHTGGERATGMLPEGVVIKEISGASLRGHGSESIADTSGMRAALGDEYEKKLRSEAARVGNVSKLAKRKNQLSSLFVDAKAQEIEQMEKQASGVKTKTETQKKYGW
jgi:hypothetical protein